MYQRVLKYLQNHFLFLFLLPVFFIYSGYNELFGFLPPVFVLKNLVILLGVMLALLGVLFLICKNIKKAAVATFFITTYSLLFGFMHDSLKKTAPNSFWVSYTFLLPATILLFVLIVFFIKKSKSTFSEVFTYLNLLMFALLLSEIPNSIKRYRLDKSVHNLIDFRFKTYTDYKPRQPIADSAKPDIFFLVFDAMASTKSLRQALNKNNSALDSMLTQKGFHIIPDAFSNYNWTIHSISTTLNMQYLPDFIAPVQNDPKAYFWGSASILNNSLTAILKNEGYKIHQYQPISFNNPAWPEKSHFQDMKDKHYYFKTLPGRIYKDIFWNYLRVPNNYVKNIQVSLINERFIQKKKDVDTALALIKNTCSTYGQSKFVYGHFMVPHDPYAFTKNGILRQITIKDFGAKKEEADLYFDQVLYAGKLIDELVSFIQKNNKKNTIIIVEGDHGFRYLNKSDLAQYTFQNLNAIYFPDHNYEMLSDSLSPVNTFRIVLNKYFNAQLPLLNDSSILVTGKKETINQLKKIPQAHNP